MGDVPLQPDAGIQFLGVAAQTHGDGHQIDQHIDWRDEVNGVREGLSSPIRRASEMDHIGEIFQIGRFAVHPIRHETSMTPPMKKRHRWIAKATVALAVKSLCIRHSVN